MSNYEISKSSLVSLKAEILRKQEELNKSKLENRAKKVKKPTPLEIKNKGIEQRELNDVNEEDENLLQKSRIALESKAKLYEKLSKRKNFTEDETERNRRFLVRFDKKASQNNNLPPEESDGEMDVAKDVESDEEQHFSDEYEPAKDPAEEWVEYTDCLGRTRKCMRKDLEFLKSKDADLRTSFDKDTNKAAQFSKFDNEKDDKTSKSEDDDNIENEFTESNELLSGDMRRELLRQQWEKEENELRKKDDIHYQDILFNEARTHGVGYYGFSKDEEERAKQQEALRNLRQETQQQQQKAQELKNLREKQLAARMKSARNRKRARMGLPPEENEPEVPQQPVEKETPDEEEQKKKLEEEKEEKKRNSMRKKHIRPWDIGKDGLREHYEYSQEEWVEKKRKERSKEFAPPSTYKRSFRSDHKANSEDVETDKTLYFSTKKNTKSEKHSRSYGGSETEMFDTSKPPPNVNPYKTKETFEYQNKSSSIFEPSPIVDECEDFDEEQDRLLNDYRLTQEDINSSQNSDSDEDVNRGKGTEIAPPATFDYYGPSDTKKRKSAHGRENLADSITAGLKFLRQQAEKKNSSTKHPSEMFLL